MCIIESMSDTKTYPLRIPVALYDAIQSKAQSEDRSMNYKITQCLASCFDVNVKPKTAGGKRTKATTTDTGQG